MTNRKVPSLKSHKRELEDIPPSTLNRHRMSSPVVITCNDYDDDCAEEEEEGKASETSLAGPSGRTYLGSCFEMSMGEISVL